MISQAALFFSVGYKNGEFAKAIHKDIDDWLKGFKAEFAQRLKNNDVQWFLDNKFDYGFEVKNNNLPRTLKYCKDFAYQALEKEIRTIPKLAGARLSDILSGVTKDRYHGYTHHTSTYWKGGTINGVEHALMKEAFAEFIDSSIAGEESLAMLKKYLPTASKIFEEMMEELLK